MKPYLLNACIGLACVLAVPYQAEAQGVVRGAQEGAAVGNKAAGPVGGAVGGAVGGVAGGVAGGVKGVLGIPQNTSTGRSSSHSSRVRRSSVMTQPSIKSALVGRPLHWTNADGTQSGTTVFYTDGTSVLTNSNLATGADDQGRWSFKGNRLCVTWEKLRPGEEKCTTWTRTGPDTYRDSDGMIVKKPDVG